MSLVKYRVKEVAADFGVAAKEIMEIISKYYEKPKSNSQVLTEDELNALFDHITLNNQISDLSVVFAVQPAPKAEEKKQEEKPAPKEAEKAPEAKEEVKKEKSNQAAPQQPKAEKPKKAEKKEEAENNEPKGE